MNNTPTIIVTLGCTWNDLTKNFAHTACEICDKEDHTVYIKIDDEILDVCRECYRELSK